MQWFILAGIFLLQTAYNCRLTACLLTHQIEVGQAPPFPRPLPLPAASICYPPRPSLLAREGFELYLQDVMEGKHEPGSLPLLRVLDSLRRHLYDLQDSASRQGGWVGRGKEGGDFHTLQRRTVYTASRVVGLCWAYALCYNMQTATYIWHTRVCSSAHLCIDHINLNKLDTAIK